MSDIYIQSTGDYYASCVGDESADLKQLVTDAIGQSVRRVGRFIQLALIGAGRCARGHPIASDTAVYLGSGRGDLEITIEVMQTLLRDGHAPKPLSFINTVSNASCYYIAQCLKLMSRSSFVCNRYFAFESVLQLAAMDLQSDLATSVLVGTVDVVVPPLKHHRVRLELPVETPVADATHWLLLSKVHSAQSLGRLLAAEHFCDLNALNAWLEEQTFAENCLLSFGQHMNAKQCETIGLNNTLSGRFDYRDGRAYYDSQSGAVIGEFLRGSSNSGIQLLHINADPDERYSVMWVEKL